MTTTTPSLATLCERPRHELEDALAQLRSGRLKTPVTSARLAAAGLRWEAWAEALGVFPREALEHTLIALLALGERTRELPSPEVVWSGVDVPRSRVQRTDVVLARLLASCKDDVLIASYSFAGARELLTPLATRVASGVRVRVIVDGTKLSSLRPDTPRQEALRRLRSAFFRSVWPQGAEPPLLYCDPRTLAREEAKGVLQAPHSMHAKCVIIDREVALVGSANFTRRAQGDNLEVGALIRDPAFVRTLLHQWESAITHGVVVPVPTRDDDPPRRRRGA
ncbi:MAG: DISARM system phospholipase D-like protein DrmC [Myxococcales bacterium]|nr:DISARM system phospholipase D-like protein DrmC [Myxococcales bacterium]